MTTYDMTIATLDQSFLDGKPGLDAETKAILFSESCMVEMFGCWDDALVDGE